ncbi:acyl-CoA dehydrogenase [Rhodococcoides trifolii]|uniref:Acyl-CoA dehydrogenase n=1 Tax=Rhodococcoides trifolii TaxID=908250 RepID=A0A917LIC3_9NOCA|nr:acyl-CoA dehydrogenase family protein [Rhodococcus trifolii]GGG26104.1 acyl-CoA dehydrogenase [Rhodococcus trifolii]
MTLATSPIEVPWPRSEPSALTPGDEQAQLRDAVRGLLAKHSGIAQVRASSTDPLGYSASLWNRLADDMSVASLAVPENRGGLGYGMVELGIILEECGRSIAPEPVYSSAALGVHALLAATEPGLDDLLAASLTGSIVVAVSALTPESDALVAQRGTDGWTVSGTAQHVIGGAEAHLVVVSADCSDGRRLFAVHSDDRISSRNLRTIDPTRRQADLTVDDASATALSSPDTTDRICSSLVELGTLALASENTGIADALLEMTVDYVKNRQQFGRPIGSFQAVKHRLADALLALERARSASRYAAAVYDENPSDASLAIAVAGAVCTDAAVLVASEAVQLHGGIGFTWEHPAQSFYRRAMGNEALQGDSRKHRNRIADLIGV